MFFLSMFSSQWDDLRIRKYENGEKVVFENHQKHLWQFLDRNFLCLHLLNKHKFLLSLTIFLFATAHTSIHSFCVLEREGMSQIVLNIRIAYAYNDTFTYIKCSEWKSNKKFDCQYLHFMANLFYAVCYA